MRAAAHELALDPTWAGDAGERGPGLRMRLAAELRRCISAGELAAHDTVPSSRSLAAQLGVSRGTVADVYDQLIGEGYLVATERSATRVAAGVAAARDAAGGVSPPAQPTRPTRRRREPPAIEPHDPPPVPPQPIDLRPGSPSTRTLPNGEWRAAWRVAAARPMPVVGPPVEGVPALRAAIADHLRGARGVGCDATDVVVTSGTADAVALVALAVADERGRPAIVAVESPGYPSVRRRLSRLGCTVVGVPTDGDGLAVDALAGLGAGGERGGVVPDLVVVTPSHQYPLGGRLPVESRLELLAWAAGAGAWVVEDDYDSEFRYVGSPLPSLAALDAGGRVCHVGSFSKTVSPWIRAAYLVVARSSALRPHLDAVLLDLSPTVSGVEQDALAHYIGSGGLRRRLARQRREYRHRRDLVLAFAASDAGAGVSTSALDGGLHTWVALRDGADARALVQALAADGVLVADLAHYYLDSTPPRPGLVFGYGAATDTELVRALDVLARHLAG